MQSVHYTTRLKKKASFLLPLSHYFPLTKSIWIYNRWKALETSFLMPQTRSLYLHSLWRNNVSKCWMSKSIFAVEGITLLKDIHFDLFVFVYLCLIWTKSKLINNHWKALEEYFLMSQKGIIYLFSLKKNQTLKYYISISSVRNMTLSTAMNI